MTEEPTTAAIQPATDARPRPVGRSSARSRRRMVVMRGMVWGVIGLIYAPLFVALVAILHRFGMGPVAYPGAAALAGAAGAALYGARELALVGTGIGLAVGLLLLLTAASLISFEQSLVVAAGLAALVGLLIGFPGQCTRQVPGKVLAGLVTGAGCGALIAVAEPLHPHPFSTFALLSVLVSANGVLYVASVRWWCVLSRRLPRGPRSCKVIESVVLAGLAAVAAGSLWIMAGPLLGQSAPLVSELSEAIYAKLPFALFGGTFGGAVAGALLEAFGFSWVDDI